MKTLSTFLFLCFFMITRAAAAQTTHWLDLQLESYYSDAPGYESIGWTHLFANKTGDTLNVGADFYLQTLSVEDARLSVYWYDDPDGPPVYAVVSSGPIDADSDMSMLNASITVPPQSTGIVHAELTIYFADGSELDHFEFGAFE